MNEEITTVERLRELQHLAAIRDRQGLVYEKRVSQHAGRMMVWYYAPGDEDGITESDVALPALLLWEGGAA